MARFADMMDASFQRFAVAMDGRMVERVQSVGGGDEGWQRHFVFHFADGSSVRVEREAMQDSRVQWHGEFAQWPVRMVAGSDGQVHQMRVFSDGHSDFERDVVDQMWDFD